ncbi:WYL domain-containing protein [Halobacillus litoralis]|uniref:WYL domain-containing protein n=1 Tax=Halobacillus litoralis TaxID=45668 RepID=UPI001F4F8626|nr:WYL domain-containing protein [Halobacillus litoralis]
MGKDSIGLIGWILTWVHKVKVISPESLVDQVREEVQAMYKQGARIKSIHLYPLHFYFTLFNVTVSLNTSRSK